jgi:hypothetical protein
VDAQELLDELVQAAQRLGVEVRSEPFETPAALGGGLCLVRGAHLVLIDQRAPLVDRLRALERALGDLGTEAVYMAPEARELVDRDGRHSWIRRPTLLASWSTAPPLDLPLGRAHTPQRSDSSVPTIPGRGGQP